MKATPHTPALFVMATFSRFDDASGWGRQRAIDQWGPIALESEVFQFDQTTYYEKSMGEGLTKRLWGFRDLIDPAVLPDRKLLTDQWEVELAASQDWEVPRPLNLDPGYLTEAKLVLASTKDRDHRIYLRDGIFAEGTIYFHKGAWRTRPWTYPDFQLEGYHEFFTRCREYLRAEIKGKR